MRLEYRFCIVLLLFSSFLKAQEERDNGAQARVEGAGARDGLALLLLNLEKESRLQWRAVNVESSDASMGAILARVNQWPIESITTATIALVCDRNPHVCCPYSPSSTLSVRKKCLRELKSNTSGYLSSSIIKARKYCRTVLDSYIAGRAKTTCKSHWEPIPTPNTAKTTEACSLIGSASPWSVCLPIITIRSEIGVQDLPFNPKTEDIRKKFELVQGCTELPTKSEIASCRSAFSEAQLNTLNFGNYRSRSLREKKITLPTQSFFIEIPSTDQAKTSAALKKALQNTAESIKAHRLESLGFNWIEKIQYNPAKTQQGYNLLPTKTLPTQQALEIMGLDISMQPITDLAPILAMDPNPLTEGNPRLQIPFIKAFSAKEIYNAATQKVGCKLTSIFAYKKQDWFSQYPPKEQIGHATEVIGVMAAQPVEGSSVFGVLAKYGQLDLVTGNSQVHALYLDDGKGERDLYDVVHQIHTHRPVRSFTTAKCSAFFPIVNVSMRFSNEGAVPLAPQAEGVLFGIASQPGWALYVVAAGNLDNSVYPQRRTQETCNHSPGCRANETENMISVVGLDITGVSPSTSSLAGVPFEVAAIGDVQTVSYVGDDKNAYGSSFSTPFVSSLASLIFGKAYSLNPSETVQPTDLKVRILQSVDFLSDLSIVKFGRINYSRAIEIDRDIIVLNSPVHGLTPIKAPFCQGNSNCYTGKVSKSGYISKVRGFNSSESEVVLEKLKINNILRLHRTSNSTLSLVYVEVEDDLIKAKILHDVQFDSLDKLVFSQDNEAQSISANLIEDYTRCMWRKAHSGVCPRVAL